MKKVGEILREKRENQSLSLQEVAAVLKISQKTLAAIESSETDGVLNRAFVKGFIRSYATYLKLDPKELSQLYVFEVGEGTRLVFNADETNAEKASLTEEKKSEETSVVAPVIAEPEPLMAPSKQEKFIPFQAQDQTQNFLMVGLLGLVVVLSVAFLIKATMKRYKNESIVVPQANISKNTEPVNLPEAAKPVSPEELKALNTPAPDVTPLIVAAPDTAQISSAETGEESKSEPVRETAENKPVVPAVPASVPAAAAETEQKPPPATAPLTTKEVIVESAGDVSISYELDNQSKKIQLKKDQVHTFKVKGPITLQISNGEMVNVNVNGRDIGKPASQAGPVSVTY